MPHKRAVLQAAKLRCQLTSSVLRLESEPDFDILSRSMMSFYLTLKWGGCEGTIADLVQRNQWITQFAAIRDGDANMKFKNEALLLQTSKEKRRIPEEPFPLSRSHVRREDHNFIEGTVAHFMLHIENLDVEDNWDASVLASSNISGVLRALIFMSKNAERGMLIDLLFEYKAVTGMRAWELASSKLANFNACPIARKFFWRIVHYYAGMCAVFDKSGNAADWNRRWYDRAIEARRANVAMKVVRALVMRTVKESDSIMTLRKEVISRRDQLVGQLRAAVISAAKPNEIHIIKNALKEVRECDSMKKLSQGIPIPPFDMANGPIATLDRAEHLLQIMDFISDDSTAVGEYLPVGVMTVGTTTTPRGPPPCGIDRLMHSVTSKFASHNVLTQLLFSIDSGSSSWGVHALYPAECLRVARDVVKAEVKLIRQLAAECAAEVQGMALEWMRGLVVEAKDIQQGIVHAAVELQTIRDNQQRRDVRREVKRIRALQKLAMAQMVSFAVELQGSRGCSEMKRKAASVEGKIKSLVLQTHAIHTLTRAYIAEETALLAQHTQLERRRVFLASSVHFLPSAMFESETECGLCLEPLQWNTDSSIGFVTCCRELGYVCGDCLAKPHSADNHDVVTELEIVRVVRGVRRALGI